MIRFIKQGRVWVLLALAVWALLGISVSLADEGMWTFDNPPLKQLKERYGFQPTREWLDHLRLASVRFNDGGSGSFVSPHGLVLTNHHVALGQLQKVSSPAKDYVKDGFYARTEAEELR
jgi:S1-C subfamily serine protease